MSNQLTISNGALQKIGAQRIMSVDEKSKEAKICAAEYDKIRKVVLRMYPWGFAAHRVVLSPLAGAPAFKFQYAYQLPSDYLRIIELYNYHGEHVVEGVQLLCDTDELSLRYVRDITDFTVSDPLFVDAFEWYLAYTISRYIVESDTVRQECLQAFKSIMPISKFVQSTENSQRYLEADDLIESRWSNHFVRDPLTH